MLTLRICDDNEMYLSKMRKLVDDYILERNFRPQHIVIHTFTSAKDIFQYFEKIVFVTNSSRFPWTISYWISPFRKSRMLMVEM